MATRRTAVLLFILFQALYALTSSGNAFRAPDEFEAYFQTEHFVDAGDISIPQAVATNRFFGKFGVDGKPYAPLSPLLAMVTLPHHLLGRTLALVAGIERPTHPRTWIFVVSGFTMLATATAAALAVAGFFVAALDAGAAESTALLLSLLLGGATNLWVSGTNLFSEAFIAAAFIWVVVCLRRRHFVAAGLLILAAALTKFTSLVCAPVFLVAVLMDSRMSRSSRFTGLAVLVGSMAAASLAIFAWNAFRFGNAFDFGYNWAESVPHLPARMFSLTDFPRGLAVLLLSPGKSLFVWAPALWLSAARFHRAERWLQVAAAVALGLSLLMFATSLYPEGGYSHGPRYLVPIVPLLLLPAAAPGPPLSRTAVWVCGVGGLTLALLATSVSYLQDQSLGVSLSDFGYYQRVVPPPGRAWTQYDLSYLPFARTITGSDWPRSPHVGLGVDWFPLHLARAKHEIPEARVIPSWLIWAPAAVWASMLVGSMIGLRR